MSIPGLGQDEPQEEYIPGHVGQSRIDVHEIQKEQEWRFEVAISKSIEVKVSRHIQRTIGLDFSTKLLMKYCR